jgi:hypothetical protein
MAGAGDFSAGDVAVWVISAALAGARTSVSVGVQAGCQRYGGEQRGGQRQAGVVLPPGPHVYGRPGGLIVHLDPGDSKGRQARVRSLAVGRWLYRLEVRRQPMEEERPTVIRPGRRPGRP